MRTRASVRHPGRCDRSAQRSTVLSRTARRAGDNTGSWTFLLRAGTRRAMRPQASDGPPRSHWNEKRPDAERSEPAGALALVIIIGVKAAGSRMKKTAGEACPAVYVAVSWLCSAINNHRTFGSVNLISPRFLRTTIRKHSTGGRVKVRRSSEWKRGNRGNCPVNENVCREMR